LIIISRLQGLQTHQEVTSVVIGPALRKLTVIIPTLRDPAGIIMIAMRLSLSLRRKHLGDPEQPQIVEGQAPLLLDIEIRLILLAEKPQSVPQNDRHSVLELALPSIQHPPCVLVHSPHSLCQLHLVLLDMSLKPRATTMTTTTTTTTTLLADNLEDPWYQFLSVSAVH